MKTPGMRVCSTRRSAVQRSTFVGLARGPLERAPEELAVAGAAREAQRKIVGRRRFADLSA